MPSRDRMGLTDLSDSLAPDLVPMPGDAHDVCPICRSGRTSASAPCYSCQQTTGQVSHPTKQVIPISYYTKPSRLRDRMHDYKEHEDAEVRRTEGRAVAAIVARYLNEHAAALADSFGGWNAAVAVPSTTRPGPPALQTAIEEHFGDVVGPFENCLTLGSGQMGFNEASENGFQVVGHIASRSFLLIDDTFTTGARLQSAHHALASAGATVPVSMVVTRKINPSETYGTEALWERQRKVPFRFDDPPWWTA